MKTLVMAPLPVALSSTANDEPLTDRYAATLVRLARELEVSSNTFFGEPPDGDAGELLALVRYWSSIETSQGRRRVLGLARQEAGRAGYRDCA